MGMHTRTRAHERLEVGSYAKQFNYCADFFGKKNGETN